MFWKGWKEERFPEKDFQIIKELGFNFARLPLDYRIWTSSKNYYLFDEAKLAWLDEAVMFGQRYNVHVCLCLHRAPGHASSDDEPEKGNLWSDASVQEAFIFQWKTFAKRYATVPADQLSFNLLNEPTGASEDAISALMQKTAVEIYKISPNRPIIADGLEWGTKPMKKLVGLPIIQATRGYRPRDIVRETKDRPKPAWPQMRVNRYLYGDQKPQLQSKLKLVGNFSKGSVTIFISQVSIEANLQIAADDVLIAQKYFKPGPGAGEWQEVIYDAHWNIYQNRYDKSFKFELPRSAKEITFFVDRGDWLTFRDISWQAKKANGKYRSVNVTATDFSDSARQEVLYFNSAGEVDTGRSPMFDRAWLKRTQVQPWIELQKEGVEVFVGETGAPKTSPHAVYLKWMRDNLENWQQADWGWALWNFRGEFGIFDSQRPDVQYEEFRGYKLDRKLLTLLQGYL